MRPTISSIAIVLLTAMVGEPRRAFSFAQEPDFRRVYVPIEDLDVLFGSQRGVLLTRSEFLELWKKAHPEGVAAAPAPDDLLIVRGDYTGTIDGNSIRIHGRLELRKNRPGWQTLALHFRGIALLDAKLDGQPAALTADDEGTPLLLVRSAGVQTLEVELAAALSPGWEARASRFRLPTAPGELTLAVENGTEILVRPADRPLPAREGKVRVPLFDGSDVELAARPRKAGSERQPILWADSKRTLEIGPSECDWREAVAAEVAARPVDALEFVLPAGWRVIEAQANDLAKWEAAAVAGGMRLTFRFARPFDGKREVQWRAVGPTVLDSDWSLPQARLVGAARQSGIVELAHDDGLAVEVRELKSARRLASPRTEDRSLRFAAWSEASSVAVAAKLKMRTLAATVATIVNVGRTRLEMNSSVTVEPRNGSLFDLAFAAPADWEVSAVEQRGRPLPFQRSIVDGKSRLHVQLPEPTPANQPVDFLIKADRSPDGWLREPGQTSRIELPTVGVEGVAEVEGMVLIRAPSEIRVLATDTSGFEPTPLAGIPNADSFVRLALRYRTVNVRGTLESLMRPALISARIDAAALVGESHLAVDYFLRFNVKQGVADRLSFELPRSVAANEAEIEALEGPGLASQTTAEVGENRRRWTLKFDRDVDVPLLVRIHVDVPRRPAESNGSTALPTLTVESASLQAGTIAIEGASDQQVTVSASNVRAIDPGELPTLPARLNHGRLVSAFQFRNADYVVSVKASRQPELAVLSAVCTSARITSVLVSMGTARQMAELTIDNAGLQSLAVSLPSGSEMLAASLDDRPVELRKDSTHDANSSVRHLIALPQTGGDKASCRVAIHYRTRVNRTEGNILAALTGEELRQQPPKLNVPIVRLDWMLYLPSDEAIVDSSGSIAPLEPLARDSITGAIRAAILRREGRRVFNPLEVLLPMAAAKMEFASDRGDFRAVGNAALPQAPGQNAEASGGGRFGELSRSEAVPKSDAPANRTTKAPAGPLRDGKPSTADLRKNDRDAEPLAEEEKPRHPADAQDAAKPGAEKGERQEIPALGELQRQAGRGSGQAEIQRRGLLSVPMVLETSGRPIEFIGTAGDGELRIKTINDRQAGILTLGLALAVMSLGWMLRRTSRGFRAAAIAALTSGSLGAAGLAPLSALFLLDGLFCGAVGLCVLYGLRGVCLYLRRRLAVTILVLASLAGGSSASAQSPNKADSPADPLPTIYVPYNASADPLASNQVYLPRDQYQTLWNLAHPGLAILPDPKTPGIIAQATFSGKVDGAAARFHAAITAWSFREDWVALKLPISGAAIDRATIDGAPAVLSSSRREPAARDAQAEVSAMAASKPKTDGVAETGFPTIYVRGRGIHRIELEFEIPAERVGDTGSVKLRLAPVGAARLDLGLPGQGLEAAAVGLQGGWKIEKERLSAAVSSGGDIEIRWRPSAAAPHEAETNLTAAVHQRNRIEISAAGIRLLCAIDLTILQGAGRRFAFEIPERLLVRQAAGEGLADWFLESSDGKKFLVLRMNRPATGALRFSVDAWMPAASGDTTPIPQLVGKGFHRESGEATIAADPALEVAVRETIGYQQIAVPSPSADLAKEPSAFADSKQWPVMAAYRFAHRPATLSLQATSKAARLTGNVRTTYTLDRERTRIASLVSLTQSGSPLVAARIRLPANFNLESVAVGPAIRWSVAEENGQSHIEVEQTGLPDFGVESSTELPVSIQGWLNRDPLNPSVELPGFEVQAASRLTGQWSVFLSPGLDAETTSLAGLRPIEPNSLTPMDGAAHRPPRRRTPRLAFEQQSTQTALRLTLRTLKPRVSADVTTVVGVRETAVAVASRLRFRVEQAGVRMFRFLAPDWLGQDVEITGFGVRQVEAFPQDDGRTRFDVGLDREFSGQYELRLAKVIGLPEDGVVRAPRIEPIDVESARSFVLLENLSADQLDRDASARGIESIEPDALPIPTATALRQRAVETLRLSPGADEPRWKLRASNVVEPISASVNLFELTMVVANDGAYRAQATLQVRNRLEQFLPLQFPEDAQVWSVMVGGQPSRPARPAGGGLAVLIPLPRTSAGDRAVEVRIVYTGAIRKEEGTLNRWRFPSPKVDKRIPVAKTQWTLHLPRDYDYGMFQGMEEVEEGIVHLNRMEAELNDVSSVIAEYRKGKPAAKLRAYSNLSTWSAGAPLPTAVRSEKGRELLQQVQEQQRRLNDELNAIRQTGAANREEEIRWTELFEEFESASAEPDVDASIADAKVFEEYARQERSVGRRKIATEPASAGKDAKLPPAQSRARLQGQLQSQAAVLNRLQNEGQLGANSTAFDANRAVMQQELADSMNNANPGVSVRGGRRQNGASTAAPSPAFAGRLSLHIELPTEGKPLHFVKARGEPELSVTAYRAELGQTGAAVAWLAAIAALSAGCAYAVGHAAVGAYALRNWSTFVMAFGVIWWLTLPKSSVGFAVFALALMAFVWQRIWARYTRLS